MEWLKNFTANLADSKYHQAVLAAVCTMMLFGFFLLLKVFCSGNIRGKVAEVKELVGVGSGKPRFRKRDKMLFYGRKMLRKVKSFSSQGKNAGDRFRSKQRQMVIKFAKKLLQLRKEQQPLQLQVKEPPPAYLEADISDSAEHLLPPEVLYMVKSLRIFGPFDKPFFLELYKRMESRFVYAGHYVFRIGDDDDSIYVVQSGRLTVFLVEQDGTELTLKTVSQGESVTSFLSFIDVLVGKPSVFKTVCARAEVDTIILKLPLGAFVNLFHRYPEYLVRVVQIVMVRLHRVSFTALYQYLGLTSQLINPTSQYRRLFSAPYQASSHSPKPSPSRSKEKVFSSSHSMGMPTSYDDKQPVPVPVADDGGGFNESHEMMSSSLPSDSDIGHSHHLQFAESSKDYLDSSEHFQRKRRPVSEISDHTLPDCLDEKDYMKIALSGFSSNLGLDDESILAGRVELREVVSGTYLIRQESMQDAALIYTLTGCLIVSQRVIDKNQETTLYLAYPGEIVGGLAVISGEPSFFTVRAKQPSRVAIINKMNFYAVMREQPRIVLHAANSIVCRLSQFVRQIDFSLDWTHIESGKPLYRQDEPSHSMYIVLSGRLRSVITLAGGKKELVGEYGKGDLVGLVELLTQTLRSTSVIAVRDTELAVMPEGLLNTIKIKFPVVVTRLVHLLGHRILGSWQRGHPVEQYPCSSASSYSTVAILPVNNDVPASQFTLELHHSLSAIGPALRLTSECIRKTLGPKTFDRPNDFRLTNWLGQQEDHHKCVLYQCDSELTAWTLRCIRQADVILIVALADQEPTVGKIEKQLESLAVRTQKDLILLHKEDAPRPHNTVQWLNIRSWCSSFHHICCPKRMFAKKSSFKMKELYKKLFQSEPSVHSDFSRLARFLTGTSIGLVLGGGGARGCAHVGMIRAIMEAGIPVDMVGGVSIGAFMGALWCMEKSVTTFTQRAREWALKMTSVWRQILDLTYPSTAMFTGAAFNRAIKEVFRDTQIEDLWLPYFTITTDITSSSMRIHTHGSLWRYVRSSMSLSGYLPPLCDPADGHLLLDGGYVNNLPADVMRTMGVHQIIAIDVGSQDETDLTNYGDELSGWWLLWKRWNPWTKPVKVPNLPEIQSRLAYVSCVRQLEEVKRHDYCIYIRPPIDNYKTLQFGSFDEIRDVGYSFGKSYFENMRRVGNLPGKLKTDRFQVPPEHMRVTSFTDLAEMVCRIQEPCRSTVLSECSDEDEMDDDTREDGYVSEPSTVLNASEQKSYECETMLRRRNTSTDLTEFE